MTHSKVGIIKDPAVSESPPIVADSEEPSEYERIDLLLGEDIMRFEDEV